MADFRLISRRVRDAYAQMPETTRYVRGMIHWLGFRQIGIPYIAAGPDQGQSAVNLLYLIDFTFNAVFNFSVRPLRLFSVFGLGVLGLTVLSGRGVSGESFVSHPPPGITDGAVVAAGQSGRDVVGHRHSRANTLARCSPNANGGHCGWWITRLNFPEPSMHIARRSRAQSLDQSTTCFPRITVAA